jgi:two-component system sensor histidine kinase ChvG
MRDMTTSPLHEDDVVIDKDWVAGKSTSQSESLGKSALWGRISMRASPLTRKIITFNLIALNVLVAGVLYLNSTRNSLSLQRISTLVTQAELIADVMEAQLPSGAPVNLATGDGIDVEATLAGLDVRLGYEVFVFDTARF